MQFHVLPKLTVSLPTASFRITTWNLPDRLHLADPKFFETGPIDIIIGAEYFLELLKEERQKATEDGPTLQNTRRFKISFRSSGKLKLVRSTLSVEESACKEFFDRTTVRNEDGRYVVTLPKKEAIIQQLELKRQYVDFMHEYLAMGHMQEIFEEDTSAPSYY
ncbi:uncharacterized protein LOC135707408 [Ochlerotatus camptorhynchus]|uniref:uncharacterized protein LOC135707408 n=1 Tax=Ochlerotatus camptorhynchus TaxID=644619 RepID=UPI0031D7F094